MHLRLWWIVLLVGACGSGGDTTPRDGPLHGDAPDAFQLVDGNDSFDEARPLALDVPVDDALQAGGDTDFFAVTFDTDSWVEVRASPGNGSPIDPRIRVYTPDRAVFAGNDDAPARGGPDADVVFHTAIAGAYYIAVTDQRAAGGPSFSYTLVATRAISGSGGVTIDAVPDPGNTAASATAIPTTNRVLAGMLDTMGDVDAFAMAPPPSSRVTMGSWSSGPLGNGSTQPSTLAIVDGSGVVLARNSLAAPLVVFAGTGDPVFIEATGDTGPAPAIWSARMTVETEPFSSEMSDSTNGTLANAEQLSYADPARFGVFGQLGPGDADFFKFVVHANVVVKIECRAQTDGSGVRGLTLRLYVGQPSFSPVPVASATETESMSASLAYVQAIASYYALGITASGQDPTVAGAYYRCEVTEL